MLLTHLPKNCELVISSFMKRFMTQLRGCDQYIEKHWNMDLKPYIKTRAKVIASINELIFIVGWFVVTCACCRFY